MAAEAGAESAAQRPPGHPPRAAPRPGSDRPRTQRGWKPQPLLRFPAASPAPPSFPSGETLAPCSGPQLRGLRRPAGGTGECGDPSSPAAFGAAPDPSPRRGAHLSGLRGSSEPGQSLGAAGGAPLRSARELLALPLRSGFSAALGESLGIAGRQGRNKSRTNTHTRTRSHTHKSALNSSSSNCSALGTAAGLQSRRPGKGRASAPFFTNRKARCGSALAVALRKVWT